MGSSATAGTLLGQQYLLPHGAPAEVEASASLRGQNCREDENHSSLLAVAGDAAAKRESAIREDIMRRVQQLQLRSGSGRAAIDLVDSRGSAAGDEKLLAWDSDDLEEGELACAIS